jgi:hypothetical protein
MKGYQAHLEKLRKDAAECALVRDLATDRARREMFDRSSGRLDQLADQMEPATGAAAAALSARADGEPIGSRLIPHSC